jgi:hypothetical protein
MTGGYVGWDALKLLKLTAGALDIGSRDMAVLRAHVNEIRQENLASMLCWISQGDVAQQTKISLSTVKEAITSLETEKKLLVALEKEDRQAFIRKHKPGGLKPGIKVYRVVLPSASAQDATPGTTPKKKPTSAPAPKATPKATATHVAGDEYDYYSLED